MHNDVIYRKRTDTNGEKSQCYWTVITALLKKSTLKIHYCSAALAKILLIDVLNNTTLENEFYLG